MCKEWICGDRASAVRFSTTFSVHETSPGTTIRLHFATRPLFGVLVSLIHKVTMAPDLNAVAAGERFDYSEPGSSGYDIDKSLTFNDPNNRKLRVLTIGGGVTGILMAYQIQKYCANVEHVIYEKNQDIGGRCSGSSNCVSLVCSLASRNLVGEPLSRLRL